MLDSLSIRAQLIERVKALRAEADRLEEAAAMLSGVAFDGKPLPTKLSPQARWWNSLSRAQQKVVIAKRVAKTRQTKKVMKVS